MMGGISAAASDSVCADTAAPRSYTRLLATEAPFLLALLVAVLVASSTALGEQERASEKKPAATVTTPATTDRYGDPLPRGAIARLGTVRMRHPLIAAWLCFSAGGDALISGDNESIRLWDLKAGRERWRAGAQGKEIRSMAVMPDGKLVVTGHVDRMRWWDAATGKEVRRRGLPDMPSEHVSMSGDGRLLGVSDLNKRITLWDLKHGKALRQWITARDIGGLACSPDGKRLAVYWWPGTVQLYDTATGKETVHFEADKERVSGLAFSPTGKLLATGGWDHKIRLWDPVAGVELGRLEGHDESVNDLAFSPDGKLLASAAYDGVRVWDVVARRELRGLRPALYDADSVAFSADGKRLACNWNNSAIRLWDVATGKEVLTAAGRLTFATWVHFLPDGKTLVSVGGNRFALWEAATGRQLRAFDGRGESGYASAALATDGKTLATREVGDRGIGLWDVASGKAIRHFAGARLYWAAFSPAGRLFALGGWPAGVRLWDRVTGKAVRSLEGPAVYGPCVFSPDGRAILTVRLVGFGGDDGVRLWDVVTGKERWRARTGPWMLRNAAFSPDGRTLAVVGYGWEPDTRNTVGMVVFHDATTGKELRRCEGKMSSTACAAFSPDGRMLATGSGDGTIHLWEVASGRERQQLVGHEADVWALSFSPNGRLLASAGLEGIGLVWDLVTRGPGNGQAKPLTDQELAACWTDLASADAALAFRRILALAASPQQAVALLRDKLRPVEAAEPGRVSRLLADLDSRRFAPRDSATRELEKLGFAAESALRQALAGKPSSEARRRIERVLARLDGTLPLQVIRAVEVLERVGTPEARQVLQAVAHGAAEAGPTREAREALARLQARAARP
jgi:WD40 repeat protein